MTQDVDDFLFALALTLLIEVPLLIVLARTFLKISTRNITTYRLLVSGIIASSVTLPLLWFVLPAFITDYQAFLLTGETIVFLIEAGLYMALLRLKPGPAFLLSFLCNMSSFLIGYAVQHSWS